MLSQTRARDEAQEPANDLTPECLTLQALRHEIDRIDDEMLELAEHIIKTKAGEFDPKEFDDRYESALAELVQAKIEGRKIKPQKRPEPTKVVSLLDALRDSAKSGSGKKAAKAPVFSPRLRVSARIPCLSFRGHRP